MVRRHFRLSLFVLGVVSSERNALAYTTPTTITPGAKAKAQTISLTTFSQLPQISPEEVQNFVSSPSNWPKIVLSSNSVQIPNDASAVSNEKQFSIIENSNLLANILRRKSTLIGTTQQLTDLTVPLKVGQSVDEIFGLPPLFPLSVTWKCVQSDVKSGRLEFYSENGVPGIASNCRMIFDIQDINAGDTTSSGSKVEFRMEFRPRSIIAKLAAPILSIDNALALKLLLPMAMKNKAHGVSTESLAPIDEFRQLMGTLYGVAGIAHLIDCTVGPSQLLLAAGAPTFGQLPPSGQLYALLWCAAGPITYAASRMGGTGRAADLGLIFYGLVEVFGAWLIRFVDNTNLDAVGALSSSTSDLDAAANAIAVQGVVALAWLYSSRREA